MCFLEHLNSIGLALDAVGVVLLYFFGLTSDVHQGGASMVIVEGSEKDQKQAKRYSMFSKLALILLVVGFVLQIISNYI